MKSLPSDNTLESRAERELPRLKKEAEELINLLRKEYHMK
jgi:hypothetical protein